MHPRSQTRGLTGGAESASSPCEDGGLPLSVAASVHARVLCPQRLPQGHKALSSAIRDKLEMPALCHRLDARDLDCIRNR